MRDIANLRTGVRRNAAASGRIRALLATTLALASLWLSCSAAASAQEGCGPAIRTAEQQNNALPSHILHAIGIVESGRRDPITGQFGAWPWSVNSAGDSRMFATREEAIAFVRDAQARGIRSIDVGCMQINLLHHPGAFASLDEAFSPEANVRYAAAFLMDLRHRTGDWSAATGLYHSATPGLSQDYARRVLAVADGGQSAAWWPARTVVPARAAPTPSTTVLIGLAARRVQVIEPGTAPVHVNLLRSQAVLPRVYSP